MFWSLEKGGNCCSFTQPLPVRAIRCWIIWCQVGWQCNIYTKDGMPFLPVRPALLLVPFEAAWEPAWAFPGWAIQSNWFSTSSSCCIWSWLLFKWGHGNTIAKSLTEGCYMFLKLISIDFTSQNFLNSPGMMCTWLLVALQWLTAWISSVISRSRHNHRCWLCPLLAFLQILCSRFVKAYLAVPFVEEMRVLTDWTITRSYQLGYFVHGKTSWSTRKQFSEFQTKICLR